MNFCYIKAVISSPSIEQCQSNYEHMLKIIKYALKSPNSDSDIENLLSCEKKGKTNKNLLSCRKKILKDLREPFLHRILDIIQSDKTPSLKHILSNIINEFRTASNCGLGLPESEGVILSHKIDLLLWHLPKCEFRFWGKIFGKTADYYIMETKFDRSAQGMMLFPNGMNQCQGDEDTYTIIDHSLNKCTYFVCSRIEGEWIRLPDASPELITLSRHLHLYFTGDLESPITSVPPFPGKEKHLLRAQIARISAATHISPSDFYQLDDDNQLIENPEFVSAFPLEDSEINLDDWVHYVEFILSRGFTRFAKKPYKTVEVPETSSNAEGRENSADEDEESEAAPPLLRSISEDDDLDKGIPAWSARIYTGGLGAPLLSLSSNYWTGAFTLASNDTNKPWWNLYIGWGQKCDQRIETRYRILPHSVAEECDDSVEELMEVADPSPEEEEAWVAAHAEMKADEFPESEEGNEGDDVSNED